jgi:hypothetical protein
VTTSYILERQKELKKIKQLERQAEASDARIAEKLKRIESGDAPATPAPKAKAEPKAKAAPKAKSQAKKPASKKSPFRRK